ncbi:MAG: LTA synthase family protein, partial [Pseudomonadales bacterium]
MTGSALPQVLRRSALLVALSGLALRCVLWLALTPAAAFDADWVALATLFIVGSGRDLLVAAAAGGLILTAAHIGSRTLRTVLLLLAALTVLLIAAELFFWSEFQSRPDRLVFHYLAYPREVLTFLQDQFFVTLLLLPFALLSGALYAWLHWPLRRPAEHDIVPPKSAWMLTAALAMAGLGLSSLAPQVSGRIPEQLASNALFGIGQAALTNVRSWERYYPAASAATPLPAFNSQRPWPTPPRHLVLIIEESFAGPTWSDPTLRAQYLPEFSALMERGWYFSNAFASGSRTTRGMEALLNGMLPLPGVATSQRANPERLPSLPRALANAGWDSAFIYAGWPDFSDLTQYWRAIGFADTTSREDFDVPDGTFASSWGYPDEVLFERLLQEMQQRTQKHERVFLSALTVSHHRPFDFPEGRIAFPADERRSDHAMA